MKCDNCNDNGWFQEGGTLSPFIKCDCDREQKSFSGRVITEEEAYEGLGNPATWKSDSEKLYKAFRMTPAEKARQELKDEFDLGSI